MKNKKYFFGNEISAYGLQYNRVDYRALAKSFDAVLCNDITKLFYSTINGDYNEPEQINGYIDNSDAIEDLQDKIEELQELLDDSFVPERSEELQEQIDKLQEQIDDLQYEQDEPAEIYQYYIISDGGARVLQDYTDEIVYHLPALDIYVWGVTHWGTSWDYVLTNIKINDLED